MISSNISADLRQQAGALDDDAIAVVHAVDNRHAVGVERLRLHAAQATSVRRPVAHPHRRLAGTDFRVSAELRQQRRP
jgi:hypothetical protein